MVKPIEGTSEKWTGQEEAELRENITKLWGYSAAREAKYNRNLNRYYNNGKGDARATIWNAGYQSLGFNRAMYDDASVQTKLNIIKSATDTITSKLSQARVRPFFDAVRGDYKTIRATRAAQEFFDQFFDKQKIYERAPEVARSAILFDGGHFWVDEDNQTIEPIPHWCLFVDPYEANAATPRGLTYGMIYRQQYPFRMVEAQFPKAESIARFKVGNTRHLRGRFVVFYDLDGGYKWYVYEDAILWRKKIDYKRLPVTSLWWSPPAIGWSTTCLADDLYTIQVQIDEIQMRIDQALRQSPFNTIFVSTDSGVKGTMLSNEAALVVPYIPGPEGSPPVVATPAPISPEYSRLLDSYIQKGYELAGISQLSAQAKKPAGLTSGVALQTMEDVESERHNVTVQAYIHQFVELAEIAVEVFPADADILPPAMGRARVKWADVKKQADLFRVQFSAGSALAKDPATKVQQIQQLQALGINLQPILPQLLEIPDLETAYSATTASYDYIQSVIEKAAEDGTVDFIPIVNMEMLFSETVRWMLRLSADESNKKYIDNLKKLLDRIMEEQAASAPPPEPVPPAPVETMPPQGGII